MNNDMCELFQSAHNGDECSIVELYSRYARLIKKLSNFANYEEAETDIIIFFLEFIKKLDVSKITKYSQGELVNYIYKSLKNHTYNLIKQKARKNIDESCMEFEMPYYDYYQEIELDNFYSYITELTKMQKKIIIGLFVYGYTISELSKILNISRQAINQNKLRALHILKQKVDKL